MDNKKSNLACVVMAAGRGTRMKSALPKVLHPVGGQPMLAHILAALSGLNLEKTVIVRAPDMPELETFGTCALQESPKGTGDAARAGLAALAGFEGNVLIINGDMPLIETATLQALVGALGDAKLAVLATEVDDPTGYGRFLVENGRVQRIVEEKDATPAEKAITLINAGAYVARAADLRTWLGGLKANNAQGELYLTDIVQPNETVVSVAPAWQVQGANTRVELAACEAVFQANRRRAAMLAGVTLIAPDTVFFSADTVLESDVVVESNVVFGRGVTVKSGAVIHPFCHIEGCVVEPQASVGPYARIRPGTHIGAGAKVGNFIELKNTKLAAGAKAGHVGYLGDTIIGEKANIGAGTITANYDGTDKHKTVIGAGAMVGVHASLVAPVTVGDGAYIAAGTTVTRDVEPDALVLSRIEQKQVSGWAARKRQGK